MYCVNTCSGKESQGKTPRTQHSKKAAARQKEARLTDFLPSEEHVKREIKHFCDWVMSLVSKTKPPPPALFDSRNLITSVGLNIFRLKK